MSDEEKVPSIARRASLANVPAAAGAAARSGFVRDDGGQSGRDRNGRPGSGGDDDNGGGGHDG
jgi:hypothetical protein